MLIGKLMIMIKRIKRRLKALVYNRYFKDYSRTRLHVEHSESDFKNHEKDILNNVLPYTLTGALRLVNLIRAVDYIEQNNLEGAIVECGVWKGGSIMAALLELNRLENQDREIYLYDTYEGMNAPSFNDWSHRVGSAVKAFKNKDDTWERIKCYSSLDEVVKNISSTSYNMDKIHFVKGEVENTIPTTVPGKIAILRLDTDWYESTKHELEHLFPLLVSGGVLIIDDYGHWEGCKKAVDEYIKENNLNLFLVRVDYTCRISIKA